MQISSLNLDRFWHWNDVNRLHLFFSFEFYLAYNFISLKLWSFFLSHLSNVERKIGPNFRGKWSLLSRLISWQLKRIVVNRALMFSRDCKNKLQLIYQNTFYILILFLCCKAISFFVCIFAIDQIRKQIRLRKFDTSYLIEIISPFNSYDILYNQMGIPFSG